MARAEYVNKEGKGRGGVMLVENFVCASVRTKLLCRTYYCTKPRTNTKSQSGFHSRIGMGSRHLQIIQE